MTQYVIDTGAVPDDGQGDPLRTAFEYTNENFNQIFESGPVGSNVKISNNTITTTVINSNLILSPSGIGKIQVNNTLLPRITNVYDLGNPSQRFNTIYVGSGGLDVTGGLIVSGNITADYFVGNGSALTGIVATTGSRVINGNSDINIPAAGSNIFVTVNGTGNIVVFSNTGAYVAGEVSATGNITGNYILGNGALLTGINVNYSNANVAAYLPTYTGNLISLAGPVITTANVAGGNITTSGQITATGNITGGNIDTNRVNAANITVGGPVSASGNITGNYILGNGALLTGINANYGNANVAAYLPTYTGNLVSLTGPVTTTANVTGANIGTTGQITALGNVTAGNVDTGKVNATTITASGNVAGAYFFGDGSQLTNLPAGNYSNANVAAYLPTYTGNLVSLTGPVTTTANVAGGNITTSGQITATGNATAGNVDTGRLNAALVTVSGPVSASGNIAGNYILGNGALLTGINANYSNANVAAYLPTYTGNLDSLTGPVTTTATVTGGNITTSGQITATGNITGGNVDTSKVNAASVTVSGPVSASGNVTGAYFFGDGSQLTNLPAGNYSNANVAAYLPTYTGNLVSLTGPVTTTANVTGGNLVTSGQATVTGNIIAGNVDATKVNAVTVAASGSISAVGNITGNNLIGVTVTGTTVTALANIVGGNISTAGQISSTGNIQGGNLNIPGGAVSSLTVSASGNIRGGNIVTPGFITATGNITGGNVDTGNIHAGNVNVDSIVSAQGNVYGDTFVGNRLSINGNALLGNISVAGTIGTGILSASGNVVGGNLLTTGKVSASGNVSGNYFVGNGALLTGITVSAGSVLLNGNSNVVVATNGNVTVGVSGTSNVAQFSNTGAYITGVVSATGNITGSNILSNNYYYANGTPVPPGIIYTANTAPPVIPAPKVTDQWYDTDNDVLYEFLNDGTSTYWIDTTSPAFAGGVVANVAISGTLVPVGNVTYDIGTSTVYFRNTYTQNLYINNRLPAYNMPVGAVVQTVMSSSLGGSITNSTGYADISYANVTITPSSTTSKVFVMATGTTSFTSLAGQDVTANTQLVRSPGTSLQIQTCGTTVAGGGIGITGSVSYSYLDSPGTIAPVTYKLQQKVSNASSTLTSTNIWLIAMEITSS